MNNWVIKLEEKIGAINTAVVFKLAAAVLIVSAIVIANWQLLIK